MEDRLDTKQKKEERPKKSLERMLMAFYVFTGIKVNLWIVSIIFIVFLGELGAQKHAPSYTRLIILSIALIVYYVVVITNLIRVTNGKKQSMKWLIAANVISAIYSFVMVFVVHPLFILLFVTSLVFAILGNEEI